MTIYEIVLTFLIIDTVILGLVCLCLDIRDQMEVESMIFKKKRKCNNCMYNIFLTKRLTKKAVKRELVCVGNIAMTKATYKKGCRWFLNE